MRPSRSLSHVSLFVPGGASDASSQDDASPACEPSWLPSSSQDDASPACEPSWLPSSSQYAASPACEPSWPSSWPYDASRASVPSSSQYDASPACEPSWPSSWPYDASRACEPPSWPYDASPACEPSWPISWPSFALREARSPPFVWIVQAVRRNPNVEERLTSRLDCGLEVRTYGELHALRSRDLNRLAGARVAPHTGLALGT